MFASCAALTLVPWLRPERTLPASLGVPAEECAPKREGGAKSRPVKEADLRRACLEMCQSSCWNGTIDNYLRARHEGEVVKG